MIIMRFKLKETVNVIKHLTWRLAYYNRSVSATTIIANTIIAIFNITFNFWK